jgi:hypothetical protein
MKPDLSKTSSDELGRDRTGHDFAGIEVYREHCFRVAELSVEATGQDFNRRLELVEAAEKFKLARPPGPARAFPIDPAADAHRLSEVIQRLSSNPERRMMDELFWFWPMVLGGWKTDEALSALNRGDAATAQRLWLERERQPEFRPVAEHNLAVLAHFAALEWERNEPDEAGRVERDACWREATERWKRVWESEAVWSRMTDRIRQLKDLRLKSGLGHRLQAWLPHGLLTIHGQLAVQYGEADRRADVERQLGLMREAGFEEGVVKEVLRDATGPVRERIKMLCKNVEEQVNKSPQDGNRFAWNLMERTRGSLDVFDVLLGVEDPTRKAVRDEVALRVFSAQVDFGKRTHDWTESVRLLEAALKLAATAKTRELLEGNLKTVRENAADTNWWYGAGYWQLSQSAVEELERAKKLLDNNNETDAIGVLVGILTGRGPSSVSGSDRSVVDRSLAFTLNRKAVRIFNIANEKYNEDAPTVQRFKQRAQREILVFCLPTSRGCRVVSAA